MKILAAVLFAIGAAYFISKLDRDQDDINIIICSTIAILVEYVIIFIL